MNYYRPKNCSELWQKFYSVFAYKDPCDFDVNSYDEFIQAARHKISTFSKVSAFLRASAMLKHVIVIGLTSVSPSVCPSVRPSHAGIVSKRLNILSCFLRPIHSSFVNIKIFAKFRRGHPLRGRQTEMFDTKRMATANKTCVSGKN